MNQGGSNPHWSCTFRCQQFQDDKTLYICIWFKSGRLLAQLGGLGFLLLMNAK